MPEAGAAFSDDSAVLTVLVQYIRIICFGYGMMEAHRYCTFFLTGLHKPAFATTLNAIRVLVLLIPLACAGAHLWGVAGVFWARLATDTISGCLGLAWVHRVLRRPLTA